MAGQDPEIHQANALMEMVAVEEFVHVNRVHEHLDQGKKQANTIHI